MTDTQTYSLVMGQIKMADVRCISNTLAFLAFVCRCPNRREREKWSESLRGKWVRGEKGVEELRGAV